MKMLDGKGAVQDAHSFVPFKLYIYTYLRATAHAADPSIGPFGSRVGGA